MSEEPTAVTKVPRRQALCGIIALGVLGPTALAACSKDNQYGQPSSSNTTSGGAAPTTSGAPNAGGGLAELSQVPVGGGTVATAPDGRKIVITQPTAGQFKAYNASCTHMGTPVDAPENGVMTCPNHGSQFNATDGSVVKGPASSPLKEVQVATQGDNIILV